MNSLKLTGAMAALCVVLSGCNTMSKASYENMQEAAKGSAAYRQKMVKECQVEMRAKSKTFKENLATVMNVSLAQTPATFCARVTNGISSGRLTYADYVATRSGGSVPKVIKVLQGR